MKKRPPFIAEKLFEFFTGYDEDNEYGSTLKELYSIKRKKGGRLISGLWYWKQALFAIGQFNWHVLFYFFVMFRNYVKITFRNLKSQKISSIIIILGFSLGLSSCLLIYLYVADDLSYDKFHINKDSIYRIVRITNNPDGTELRRHHQLPHPVSGELSAFFPEIKHFSRFKDGEGVVSCGNIKFNESIYMADPDFFKIFTFPLISGNPETALRKDNSIVLTQKYAVKLFGENTPAGKTLTLIFGNNKKDFIVTGIVKNPPENSTIKFNILVNIKNYAVYWPYRGNPLNSWQNFSTPFYVLLDNDTSPAYIKPKFKNFYNQYFGWYTDRQRNRNGWKSEENPLTFDLQKLTDIHLDPSLAGGTDPKNPLILSGIAYIILLIGCINYSNLSAGMSWFRLKEIGMRKAFGAGRQQLVRQFWCESLIITVISLILAIVITKTFLPLFNDLTGKILSINSLFTLNNILVLSFSLILISIFSTIYPAIIITKYKITDILKRNLKIGNKKSLTKLLVILQFSFSILLIAAAVIFENQLNFLFQKDVGFQKDGLFIIDIQENEDNDRNRVVNFFKNEASGKPDILSVTVSTTNFGDFSAWTSVRKEGKEINFMLSRIDRDFVKTMGMDIIEGRDFSAGFASDKDGALINEAFMKELNYKLPVGKAIDEKSDRYPSDFKIIGILKDFNFQSLHNKIFPAMFYVSNKGWNYKYMIVRINQNNIKESLAGLKNTWERIQPEKPFIYSFLDDVYDSRYFSEKKWHSIIRLSSFFALLISCMGIFGLTSISLNTRIKEFGIRKVLGAGFTDISNLILKEYGILIIAANIIAWPAAYYVMTKWIQNFAYRIDIGFIPFFTAAAIALLLTLITISYHIFKSAASNPVDSLRNE